MEGRYCAWNDVGQMNRDRMDRWISQEICVHFDNIVSRDGRVT